MEQGLQTNVDKKDTYMSYPIPKALVLEPKENGMCVYVSSVSIHLQTNNYVAYSVDKMLSTFVYIAYVSRSMTRTSNGTNASIIRTTNSKHCTRASLWGC